MNKINLTDEELKQIEYHKVLSSKTRYRLLKLIKEGQGSYNLSQIKKMMNCSYQGLLDNARQLERVGLIILNQNTNVIGKPIYPMIKNNET